MDYFDQEQKVSIFDSEEQDNTKNEMINNKHQLSNKTKKSKMMNFDKNDQSSNKRGRRKTSQMNVQKKLKNEQRDIMKLMGGGVDIENKVEEPMKEKQEDMHKETVQKMDINEMISLNEQTPNIVRFENKQQQKDSLHQHNHQKEEQKEVRGRSKLFVVPRPKLHNNKHQYVNFDHQFKNEPLLSGDLINFQEFSSQPAREKTFDFLQEKPKAPKPTYFPKQQANVNVKSTKYGSLNDLKPFRRGWSKYQRQNHRYANPAELKMNSYGTKGDVHNFHNVHDVHGQQFVNFEYEQYPHGRGQARGEIPYYRHYDQYHSQFNNNFNNNNHGNSNGWVHDQPHQQQQPQLDMNFLGITERMNLEQRQRFLDEEFDRLKAEYQQNQKKLDMLENQQTTGEFQKRKKVSQQRLNKMKWLYTPLNKITTKKFSDKERGQKTKGELRLQMLRQLLAQNPFMTQMEMTQLLRHKDPIMNEKIDRSMVMRLLKIGNFKKKRVSRVDSIQRGMKLTSDSEQKLRQYACNLQKYLDMGYGVCYLDQMVVNQYLYKEAGWVQDGRQFELQTEKVMNQSIVILLLMYGQGLKPVDKGDLTNISNNEGRCLYDARMGDFPPQQYCSALGEMLKKAGQGQERRLLVVRPVRYRKSSVIFQIASRRAWQVLVVPDIEPIAAEETVTQQQKHQHNYEEIKLVDCSESLNPLQGYINYVRELLKKRRVDVGNEGLVQRVVEILKESQNQRVGKKCLVRTQIYLPKAVVDIGKK